jgi:DNA mismatch endonuclease, patch repair protein
MHLANGTTATASVELKHFAKTRRIYAYLRYSFAGKTLTLYVGDATADCREDALRLAWSTVHKRKLLDS